MIQRLAALAGAELQRDIHKSERDIAPCWRRCATCHQANVAAPFSLLT
jgi:hypothetical protein